MYQIEEREVKRLKCVSSYRSVNDSTKQDFDQIARVAAILADTPSVLISFMDVTHHTFISNYGINLKEIPREEAFCEHLLKNHKNPLIVENAHLDERFVNNTYVVGYPFIIFYAGFPIITHDDYVLGTLCVIDHKPREISQQQIDGLSLLANQILQIFELQKKSHDLELSKAQYKHKSERFSNIIEASNVGTWEWDLNSGNVHFNDKLAEMLGYDLYEMQPETKDSFTARVHKNDVELFEKTLTAYFDGETDFYTCEYRLRDKNGGWVWILDRGRTVTWNSDGTPKLMFGTHADITQRKVDSRKLANTNKRLKIAQKIAKLGYWELNRLTNKEFWSNQIFEIWSINPRVQSFNYTYLISTVHPDDVDQFKAKFQTESSTSESSFHFRILVDGKIKWIRCSKTFKLFNPAHIEGTFQDITSQKLLKLSLVESEKRYSDLFQLMPIPSFVYNLETLEITEVNLAAEKDYGFTREEFLSMTLKDLRPQDDIQILMDAVNRTKKEIGLQKIGVYRHKRKDASEFKVEIHSNQLHGSKNFSRVVMAVNISDTLNYIKQIEDRNTRLQEISHVQSHVVRAPLAKMMGIIGLINEDFDLDTEENKMFLTEILESAKELDKIIRSISNKASQLNS
ncbi:PAS domain S-box protein [Leeuwenhoekiella aequorea]|uniref:PAS domain S-box-containing protein n=1 Tax=Leeuwenhoekiella aequorea TaxID=283736 RepID=A0A4Q0P9N9_9FLAO|nr:PAS domain S-box protein [Leeuwenhoekiella aequorea]RXG23271.1 PAS domain S-box-containing protein [Leeuwenhoekiella aequorea]